MLEDDGALGKRLWDLWPQWGQVDAEALRRLTQDLIEVRDELKPEAIARGWEVD